MSSRILIVGYSDLNLAAAREDWKGYNVQLEAVNTAAEAIIQFSRRQYIAVIASYDLPDIAPLFELISETNRIPLVALSQRESGIKFAGSIINGANKFILDLSRKCDCSFITIPCFSDSTLQTVNFAAFCTCHRMR